MQLSGTIFLGRNCAGTNCPGSKCSGVIILGSNCPGGNCLVPISSVKTKKISKIFQKENIAFLCSFFFRSSFVLFVLHISTKFVKYGPT